jgi:hypothetical protein
MAYPSVSTFVIEPSAIAPRAYLHEIHQNIHMSLPRRQYETLLEWALRVLESYERKRDILVVPKVLRKPA